MRAASNGAWMSNTRSSGCKDGDVDWRQRLAQAKEQLVVLLVALRHPRTPWLARVVVLLVVAYAVSPIDLIPDPIPVLGLLDDALLLPLGIALAIRLVPDDVLEACRAERASGPRASRGVRAFGTVLVLTTWAALVAVGWWLFRR